jgi:cell division protein FtsW
MQAITSRLHMLLALAVVVLMALGTAVLASAGYYSKDGGGVAYTMVSKHLVMMGAGVVLWLLIWSRDYHELIRLRWWLYGAAVVALALCFVPSVGHKVNGAFRWIRILGFQAQPSEFAKVALAVTLAAWYAYYEKEQRSFRWGFLVPFVLLGLVAGLIGGEMDLGSAIITCCMSIACMLVAGMRKRYLALAIAVVVSAGLLAAYTNENRFKRLRAFVSELPEPVLAAGMKLPLVADLFDKTKLTEDEIKKQKELQLQQKKAKMAFGSGGIHGVGLGLGRMVMYGLPEAPTDFILPNLGEEFGLVGTLSVAICFGIIVITGFCISGAAPTRFGQLLGLCVTTVLGLEGVVNIGVTTGLFPNKGLPLPFVSYGGTSMVMSLIMVGILFSIHRQSGVTDKKDLRMLGRKRRWTPAV